MFSVVVLTHTYLSTKRVMPVLLSVHAYPVCYLTRMPCSHIKHTPLPCTPLYTTRTTHTLHRGLAFEGALHRDMGNIEVADQNAAVAFFVGKGLIDKARVGMFGWSYGGECGV